jgi:glycosidase
MQWTSGPVAGFSRGLAWEPLQPDSLTANVEAEDRDSTSLLTLYRRLIHLRASNAAIGMGDLISLEANRDDVAAYIRRQGARTVLVIANLGTAPASDVALASRERVLSPGAYTPRVLLGAAGGGSGPLRVEPDGFIRGYIPARSLGPLESRVLELTTRPR